MRRCLYGCYIDYKSLFRLPVFPLSLSLPLSILLPVPVFDLYPAADPYPLWVSWRFRRLPWPRRLSWSWRLLWTRRASWSSVEACGKACGDKDILDGGCLFFGLKQLMWLRNSFSHPPQNQRAFPSRHLKGKRKKKALSGQSNGNARDQIVSSPSLISSTTA